MVSFFNLGRKIMSVLEKIGITDDIIEQLKKEGLMVPRKIRAFKKVFRTPGEEWVYYAADRFTPPLSRKEKAYYLRNPEKFCETLIERLLFFSKVSGLLFEFLEKIDHRLRNEEAAVAYFSILYIFHACGDYNYYKYDRQFEYEQYEESVVGYFYQKLKNLCIKSAKNRGLPNPERKGYEEMLELISIPLDERVGMNSEYLISCGRISRNISSKIPNFKEMKVEDLLEKVKKEDEILYQEIISKSKYFFKLPSEFLKDCVERGEIEIEKIIEEIEKKKIKARNTYQLVSSGLKGKQRNELDRILKAIQEFILTHHKEIFISSGITPNNKSHLLDTFFTSYTKFKECVEKHPEFINERYQNEIREILRKENPIVAARKLVEKGEKIFSKPLKTLYLEELERWLS
jgi:hypothetical protein